MRLEARKHSQEYQPSAHSGAKVRPLALRVNRDNGNTGTCGLR